MSKTPVHVALERLKAEGFVNVSPQQDSPEEHTRIVGLIFAGDSKQSQQNKWSRIWKAVSKGILTRVAFDSPRSRVG